jgi:hypothetical protein
MIEHYEIEDYIDRLRPLKFITAKFIFLDDVLQSEIIIKLQIQMDGDVKLNESSVVLVHIPYKVPEESKEESKKDKKVYRAYGKVSKIGLL